MEQSITTNEALRLATLKRYRIMGTTPEVIFNELAQLAAHVVNAPMATIAFIDDSQVWYKAKIGYEKQYDDRAKSLATHILQESKILLIPDARADSRFQQSPEVIAAPFVRFFAGIPLRASNNQSLGALCVIDSSPRDLDKSQLAALRLVGRQIMIQLESRLRQVELQRQVMHKESALSDTKNRLRTAVTERLEATNEADENRERFRFLTEYSNDLITRHGPDNSFLYTSPAVTTMLGYETEDLIGRSPYEFCHPDDLPTSKDQLLATLEQADVSTSTYRFRHKDGNYVWLETISRTIRDVDTGGPIEIIANSRDVTARVMTEQALRASEARFRRVVDQAADAMFLFTPDGQILDVNQEACHSLGYHRDELTTLSMLDVDGAYDEQRYEAISELELGDSATFVTQFVRKDGESIETEVRIGRLDSGEHLALTRDISERMAEQDASLGQRDREISMSRRIAQEIASQPNLTELYRTVVDLIKQEFGYYHVQLFGHDVSTDSVQLLYGYGTIGSRMVEMNHTLPIGVGAIGVAAITHEAVLQPRLAVDPSRQLNPLLKQAMGELAVPILIGNQLLGVLDVLSDQEDQLSENDRVAMESICNQLAIAVDSTRLRRELEGQLQELSHLQRLMSREGWQNFQQQRTEDSSGYYYDRSSLTPINGNRNNENGVLDLNNESQILVTEPISIRGEVIGHLGVQDLLNDPMAPEDRELLAAISQQVAEAMENARLLEQTQKRAVELETVAQVSAATATILESKQLLQDVVDLTKHSFNLYHAHIYLLEQESGDLVLTAGAGRVGRRMAQENWRISMSQAQSLVARAAREQKGIIVNDVRQDPTYLPNLLLPDTRSEMAVPMISGNTLIGILDVQSDTVKAFSAEDAQTHESLAAQIAVALQNAVLFEEQLQTAEQLREVDKLKSEFLASMSHELRTPLNSIIGFADVLLEGLDGVLTDRMEEDVKLIRSSGAHLRDLIGEILDMSKIEAGKMELRYEDVDFAQLAYEVLAGAEKYAVTHEKTHLTIMAELDEDVHYLEADRTRLTQILNNLVSNAIKFTDEGGVTLKASHVDGMLRVTVQDTGIGLSQENMTIIFEQFRQIGATLTGHGGSTGLGLPITKSLVELHHGDIWATSELGHGSAFIFEIPLNRVIEEDELE